MNVRTAVIPAAGMGTRFLPVTKAVPKELLPIVDVPALQLVMDEAVAAGVDHIVIVSSLAKPAVAAYTTPNADVVARVRDSGRPDLADRLSAIGSDVRVSIVNQDAPRGLGHAVGCAREAVGDQPFAVLLPDEIMGDAVHLSTLMSMTTERHVGSVGLMRVPRERVSAYGVVTPSDDSPVDGPFRIVDVVEKPKVEDAPSDLIIIGRYVLTPDVFSALEKITPHANGELQLTDALRLQTLESPLTGVINTSARYDTGTPFGWLTAVIDIALQRPDTSEALTLWLRERLS